MQNLRNVDLAVESEKLGIKCNIGVMRISNAKLCVFAYSVPLRERSEKRQGEGVKEKSEEMPQLAVGNILKLGDVEWKIIKN